jgi:hypothetical protein
MLVVEDMQCILSSLLKTKDSHDYVDENIDNIVIATFFKQKF